MKTLYPRSCGSRGFALGLWSYWFFGAIGIGLILPAAPPAQAASVKVAVVLDKGGRDDKSFNSAAVVGTERAKKELPALGHAVTIKIVEAADDNAYEALLRGLSRKDFDLIIAVGVSQAEAVSRVAPTAPERKFAIVDSEVKLPNVRSLLFEEHEGSFLVGALAALFDSTGSLGFLGGMDIPLIRRFEKGYQAGVKHIRPKAKLISNYIGVTGDAWNNPAKAKELALSQYASGVNVIFAAAGASNAGVFDAAEEKKKFVIGVDSNQNAIKPGRVLTSMLKRVDEAVLETIKLTADGKFTPGVARFGLKNRGIDYAVDEHNAALLTPAIQKRMDQIRTQILSGAIKVPDFYAR